MAQSTYHSGVASGLHVAIIMDGNGRWAQARGLPRSAGHREGVNAVRRVVEAALGLGIRFLTLHVFSADNWKRPEQEVSTLLQLLREYLLEARQSAVERGVRISLIGRRDRLPQELLGVVAGMEEVTQRGECLHVRLAVDYSSRDALVSTARLFHCPNQDGCELFARCLGHVIRAGGPARDVDLLIRTGGEQRLSDFLLWECAYAELYFTGCMWPDFDEKDLQAAVEEFRRRERRFGKVGEKSLATSS